MNILLPGPYPRSEHLVAVTRDVERDRQTLADLKTAWQEEIKNFKSIQAGLPYYSTGLFQWQDLLRPFVDLIPGTEANGLSRFYETNSFWRTLQFPPKARVNNAELDNWIDKYFLGGGIYSKNDPMIFTLPFAFIFKDYTHGINYPEIAHILEQVAVKLLSMPNKALCFFDATFGWRALSKEEQHIGLYIIESIKKKTQAPIYLWSSFFNLKNTARYLFNLPFDGFGIDFYANAVNDILPILPKDKTLLAGIINTESTLIEPKSSIEAFYSSLTPHVSDDKLYFIPNGPAEFVPKEVMDKKVKNLQEILPCLHPASSHTK